MSRSFVYIYSLVALYFELYRLGTAKLKCMIQCILLRCSVHIHRGKEITFENNLWCF